MNGSLKLEDKVFLTKLAEEVKARRMTTPAIFFLEMMRPLNFVGSQAMIFFGPIISAFVKTCLLYTSPSPRDATLSRMPSSA